MRHGRSQTFQTTNNLKECALRLWDHGWELEDICEAFGVSQRSCYRWRQIFEECGTATKPPSPLTGHTRTIMQALLMAVKDLFAEDSDLFLDEVCTWLTIEHNITVSTSTLSCNLKDAGLTRKILRKLASECDENNRTYARHYGRAPSGDRAQLTDVFVRGDRYSLCAAMTVQGYIAAQVVEGSFDAQEFYDFIAEDVLPHMHPFPGEHSVIVLDNCRIHHNEDLVDLVESAGLFL
ncbi:uncharacterized protein F5147DRAFT_748740 [Suillus discolor]|uniref:Tc1-like transposase DDE domain-containing protein n=1 Tax=Suillus discolor TaxID=1912936 RepID=A0A9P7EQT9_9AGAM|nr:uncharacterized protein F5147DRAFT_748740 [Suillus discolor]KAG2085194.1 hypothetical protein F5147DRAFT_748740 [Suillus discolor]